MRTAALLRDSKSLSAEVRDVRLGIDIAVIQTYAERIVRLLQVRDPLRERVHLNKFEMLTFSLAGIAGNGSVGARATFGAFHPLLNPVSEALGITAEGFLDQRSATTAGLSWPN